MKSVGSALHGVEPKIPNNSVRGADLSGIASQHVNAVTCIVNGQASRILGYQSHTILYGDPIVH